MKVAIIGDLTGSSKKRIGEQFLSDWRIAMVSVAVMDANACLSNYQRTCQTMATSEYYHTGGVRRNRRNFRRPNTGEFPMPTPRSTRSTQPSIAEVLISISKLGGYLARKIDGPPGTLVLWRGWKRLMDIAEGWSMALRCDIWGLGSNGT